MSRQRGAILFVVFLAGAAGGFGVAFSFRPHIPDAPSPLFRGPQAVERALDQRVGEISLNGEPFDEAIVKLCVAWQVPIDVQWESLDADTWDPRRPIYFRARDVTLERALSYVLFLP